MPKVTKKAFDCRKIDIKNPKKWEKDYEHEDLVRKDPQLRPVEKQHWRCLKNHMQKI